MLLRGSSQYSQQNAETATLEDTITVFLQGVLLHSKFSLPFCNILQWTGRRSITYVRSNQSDCFESLVFLSSLTPQAMRLMVSPFTVTD